MPTAKVVTAGRSLPVEAAETDNEKKAGKNSLIVVDSTATVVEAVVEAVEAVRGLRPED